MRAPLVGVIAFVGTMLFLLPGAFDWPQHGDELQYVWSAGYFGARAARFDFSPEHDGDPFLNPGWDPFAWWDFTQPMGARLIYALAMGLTHTAPPAEPFSYGLPPHQELVGPSTMLAYPTLVATRCAAMLCSALGAALLALRLRWRGLAVVGALLVLPDNRYNFTLAWAEGPLLLGFGLCAATFGSRWFGVTSGVAATFKLTALAVWLLTLWPGATGGRRGWLAIGAIMPFAVWAILTPPSWYAYGPVYLVLMVRLRLAETPEHLWNAGGGLNPHYGWPFELGVLLVLALVLPRVLPRLSELRGRGLLFERR